MIAILNNVCLCLFGSQGPFLMNCIVWYDIALLCQNYSKEARSVSMLWLHQWLVAIMVGSPKRYQVCNL